MSDVRPGDRLDRYQVTGLLARGGMASIFEAVDLGSGAVVVLKVPHVQFESDVVFYERFRREEAIGQRLDHPNVVRFLEAGERSRPYLVMEHVDGRPLSDLLRRREPFPVGEALGIARQVCDALAHLHARGVVHRDVKPENVMVTAGGRVKILDFGIALLEGARRLTWAGLAHALGTPDYVAPEQIRGRRGDARSDVYGLGTMLYEMLTGRLPYESPGRAAPFRARRPGPPTPPSRHAPGIDEALERVVLRAIEPDPRDRQQSAAELLRELCDPPAAAPRAAGAVPRRRRLLVRRAVLSVVLGAVLAGLGSLVWLGARHASAAARPAASRPAR